MSDEIVFIPDLQIMHHDETFVDALVEYVIDTQPQQIIVIGDTVDCTAPARWNKGTAEEFADSLQSEFDTFARIFGQVRGSYSGPIRMHFGNHEQRITSYLSTRAPALASLRCLHLPELLSFDALRIDDAGDFLEFTPGWLSTHGHLGGKLSKYGGGTAIGLARATGKSVVCGHTHRLGIIPESMGYSGALHTIVGVEVGHGMREEAATYMSGGVMNWQKGFAYGILSKSGQFAPGLVLANSDSTFCKDGKIYGSPRGRS